MKKNIMNLLLIVATTISISSCSPKAAVQNENPATSSDTITQAQTTKIENKNNSQGEVKTKTVTKAKGNEPSNETTKEVDKDAKEDASQEAKETSVNEEENGNTKSLESSKITLVTKDPQNFEKKEVKAIELDSSKPIEDNLQVIADELSKAVFEGNEIKVKEIKEEDGKKVAYINLVGKDKWNNFFQGSTGGSITQFTLIDSFLQREYKGDWVDGVHFTLDDKDIEFEHTPGLSGTRFKVEERN